MAKRKRRARSRERKADRDGGAGTGSHGDGAGADLRSKAVSSMMSGVTLRPMRIYEEQESSPQGTSHWTGPSEPSATACQRTSPR
jgi:hypothetical protein